MGQVHLALHIEPVCYYSCSFDTYHDQLLTDAEQAFTDVSSLESLYHVSLGEVIPVARAAFLQATHTGLANKIQTVVGLGAVGFDYQATSANLWQEVSSGSPGLCP